MNILQMNSHLLTAKSLVGLLTWDLFQHRHYDVRDRIKNPVAFQNVFFDKGLLFSIIKSNKFDLCFTIAYQTHFLLPFVMRCVHLPIACYLLSGLHVCLLSTGLYGSIILPLKRVDGILSDYSLLSWERKDMADI